MAIFVCVLLKKTKLKKIKINQKNIYSYIYSFQKTYGDEKN
jgi:hypothetical protein